MHLLGLHHWEPLQGGSEGIYIQFRSVKRLKYLGAILQVQANVFPPTMTKTSINSQLEVITPAGEGEE